ncbi:MAG TPA: flagellar basal body-associated FliL family protein [Burkholderiaceae bacterium]|nr:flagellar basal body-associated FliL family protein [Burkholderiaceae bacterium]
MATAAEPAAEAPVKETPKKKKLVIIVVAVVLLLVAVGGVGLFLMKRNQASEDGEEVAAEAASKTPPTFLPMENMVVNLADPGGERFAQIGVTLELADKKTEDRVKSYLPAIRSGILLIVSQRTSEELLQREGKEKLAADILVEVSRPLGLIAPKPAMSAKAGKDGKGKDDESDKKSAPKGEPNPVQRVLFSSFIVQ